MITPKNCCKLGKLQLVIADQNLAYGRVLLRSDCQIITILCESESGLCYNILVY